MTQLIYGRSPKLTFVNESHYYEALGFLLRNLIDNNCRLVNEQNQNQGAWSNECRVQIFNNRDGFLHYFGDKVSAGVGACLGRINCNEYIEHIERVHHIVRDNYSLLASRNSIPALHIADFDAGYDNV